MGRTFSTEETRLGGPDAVVVSETFWRERFGSDPQAAGLVLGLLGATALGGVIGGILYGIEPTDPLTYVGSAILLFTVVIAPTALPARRASRIPPLQALQVR